MLLSGKPIAQQMKIDQQRRITASGITPKLAIIQAGDDLASTTYVTMKQRYGHDIGAIVDHHRVSGEPAELRTFIQQLNNDASVHGIIIQLPLPDRSITDEITALITPSKDVDGLGPHGDFRSATAVAVMKLLEGYDIELNDKRVTVVGRGRLVGMPLMQILRDKGVAAEQVDKTTPDLAYKIKTADVVISATGAGNIIHPGMVKAGAVVIDVGTGEDESALVGDVDPSLQEDETFRVSPSKGGVGPLTVGTLFEQLLQAAHIKE